MAEKAPPTEPPAVAEAKETNLIENAPPPEPKARREAAATASDTAPATARAGERVTTLYGSFRLRLASYRQPANAEKGWRILSKKHKDLLSALNYAVAEVDLGAEKGIYHRLETGPFGSLEEAAATCAEIKSRGDSCVVVRP